MIRRPPSSTLFPNTPLFRSVPNTGNWNTFQWVGETGVPLTAGTHVLKIVADQQYFNLNSIRVLAMSAPSPYSGTPRSEEHTSELQSRLHLVCRLLLAKKTIV